MLCGVGLLSQAGNELHNHNTLETEVEGVFTVKDAEFHSFIQERMRRMLALSRYLERLPLDQCCLTRPLLGDVLSQCSQLAELFDAFGALNNRQWHYMRHLMSAGRLFSQVGYLLLHVSHSFAAYKLLPAGLDAIGTTDKAIRFNSNILLCLASEVVREGLRLKLVLPDVLPPVADFVEVLPPGRLPHDCPIRKNGSPARIVVNLATAFLNLASESDVLHAASAVERKDYIKLVPDPVSEETLRILEQKFHNLQSLYDTYVSDTDTEQLDPDLPFLRGHISLIFHLLESATLLTHYYERHLRVCHSEKTRHPLVDPQMLLEQLLDYQIAFSSEYLKNAVSLCQKMLCRYAKTVTVSVPVPKYRGFHVRPSTLVAKICLHYGSEVKMQIGEESYDARAPLDIFRANEYINAVKRRKLADELSTMNFRPPQNGENLTEAVRQIVYALAYKQKLVIYEHPLPVRDISAGEVAEQLFQQLVLNEIARLLAMGKLDIESSLQVIFTGDERVLHDLQVLAEHGYGEDDFGNNVPLPAELAYLRR